MSTPAERAATITALPGTDRAVLDGNRRLLPRINYVRMATQVTMTGPTTVSSLLAERHVDTATVYVGANGLSRLKWLYTLARSGAIGGLSTTEKLSWMYSMLEAAIPGFARAVAGDDVHLTFVDIPVEAAEAIKAGTVVVEGGSARTGDDDEDEVEEVTTEMLARLGLPHVAFAKWNPAAREVEPPAEDTSAGLAMLGLLLYAISKTPNDRNSEGFQRKRPAGMAGTLGRDSLPASWIPTDAQYRFASSVFQILPGPRQRLVQELCVWGKSTRRSFAQGVLVSQTRLWRGHGLGGLAMVRELLANWGSVIERLPELTAAVLGFEEHEARYQSAQHDTLRDYRNIIHADLSELRGNGQYTVLVMIARDFQARNAASMRNFGQPIGPEYESRIREFASQVELSVPTYAD